MMRPRFLWTLAVLLLLLVAQNKSVFGSDVEEEEKRRSIRLKTTGQLKKIFKELDIDYQESMTKQQLQDLAYDTDAVEQWLELHPEKRRKKTPPPPNFGERPEGMDQAQWERLMNQMHGRGGKPSFDHVQDPERREILQRLSAAGLQIPNAEDMDMDKLRNLGKILDDIPNIQKQAGAGGGAAGAGAGASEEEDVQEL